MYGYLSLVEYVEVYTTEKAVLEAWNSGVKFIHTHDDFFLGCVFKTKEDEKWFIDIRISFDHYKQSVFVKGSSEL